MASTTTEATNEQRDNTNNNNDDDDEDTGAQIAPIIKLEEVVVSTGEENEDALLDLSSSSSKYNEVSIKLISVDFTQSTFIYNIAEEIRALQLDSSEKIDQDTKEDSHTEPEPVKNETKGLLS
ncbi:hypothetical protein ACFE04_002891 [Oxalis oulophora]